VYAGISFVDFDENNQKYRSKTYISAFKNLWYESGISDIIHKIMDKYVFLY